MPLKKTRTPMGERAKKKRKALAHQKKKIKTLNATGETGEKKKKVLE